MYGPYHYVNDSDFLIVSALCKPVTMEVLSGMEYTIMHATDMVQKHGIYRYATVEEYDAHGRPLTYRVYY